MKKTFVIIITVILYGGFFVSCSANRGFVSSLTCADIRQVQQFEPLNYVGIIEKGNKITYSDSLTTVAQGLFETALSKDRTLPVTRTIIIEDSIINNRVQYEIYMLMNYVENNVRMKDIPIPPVIDSILEARDERFGLLAYNWGFTRTGGNYAGQIGKGVLIGVLTMGTVYTVPYKDMSRCGIIIVDSKNNNLAYVATANRESDPLKAETYRRQMEDLLKKYRK
ncbi:MAG: hypothetical protein IKH44_09385 [Bacteroidales bacterium]|nr:hypothetical protein [Bacteroidales bacterium]